MLRSSLESGKVCNRFADRSWIIDEEEMFEKVVLVDQDRIEIWSFDRAVDTEEVFVSMIDENGVYTLLKKLLTKMW
jgi:hypothetical protein